MITLAPVNLSRLTAQPSLEGVGVCRLALGKEVGIDPITWTATSTVDWLSVSLSSGTMALSDSARTDIRINGVALSLAAGTYTGSVIVTDTTTGQDVASVAVSLTLTDPPEDGSGVEETLEVREVALDDIHIRTPVEKARDVYLATNPGHFGKVAPFTLWYTFGTTAFGAPVLSSATGMLNLLTHGNGNPGYLMLAYRHSGVVTTGLPGQVSYSDIPGYRKAYTEGFVSAHAPTVFMTVSEANTYNAQAFQDYFHNSMTELNAFKDRLFGDYYP